MAARRTLAEEVKRACADVGFLYGPYPLGTSYQRLILTGQYSVYSVKNHGIPEETIEAVISASKRFFSLPDEDKLEVCGMLVVFIL